MHRLLSQRFKVFTAETTCLLISLSSVALLWTKAQHIQRNRAITNIKGSAFLLYFPLIIPIFAKKQHES